MKIGQTAGAPHKPVLLVWDYTTNKVGRRFERAWLKPCRHDSCPFVIPSEARGRATRTEREAEGSRFEWDSGAPQEPRGVGHPQEFRLNRSILLALRRMCGSPAATT